MPLISDLSVRVLAATLPGRAAKKTWAPWRLSDTILSGSRPQVLLYGPRRGRPADQGEWSEGRTFEEDGAQGLAIAVQAPVQVQTRVPVAEAEEAFRSSNEDSYRQ